MNSLKQHIEGFKILGHYLRHIDKKEVAYAPLMKVIQKTQQSNGWFTEENCLTALSNWGEALKEQALMQWTQAYKFNAKHPKTIGLILAGNIPLVGFHDILSVLLCGHKAIIKLSSSDPYLIPFIYEKLIEFAPVFQNRLHFTQERLHGFDAVIATGSNNAARYFEYYFGKVPHIIRKNRNGIAVLKGDETPQELDGLAQDILQFFGLGCRSIAKVYLPTNYPINTLYEALFPYSNVMDSSKYANNYDYNKAVFLMSEFELLDNGFMLMRESDAFASPVACLHYSYYDRIETLEKELEMEAEKIQCISSKLPLEKVIPLGKAQCPNLWDYADGVDPISFLLEL
ncbi:MAG: acyl-CoA reductase [Flavobacteriaceae bacterium]